MIGPNGAGKTTLLSILAGIRAPDEGEVEPRPAGEVGWVPQQAALYRRLTVAENLLLFARLEGVDDPEATRRGDARADRAWATAATTRSAPSPAATSSGSTSRSACSPGPPVLLLDEPSTGLDPRQRARLWEFVLGPRRRAGTTVIFSTHYIQEAERYGDRLLVLADGERRLRRHPAGAPRGGARVRRPRDFEEAFVPSCASGATRAMRWLLLKDLQILRRSPLVTALLIIYPIVIAVLIGFALSRGPEKPRVAFLNEVAHATSVRRSAARTASSTATARAASSATRIECIDVELAEEAEQHGPGRRGARRADPARRTCSRSCGR